MKKLKKVKRPIDIKREKIIDIVNNAPQKKLDLIYDFATHVREG